MALLMDPDADHATVVAKAAAAFSLNPDGCSLVRLSGGKVRNDKIVENGCSYRWSLSRYLRTAFARSSTPKLGIFCESGDSEVNV